MRKTPRYNPSGEPERKFWIGVASKEHVLRGVKDGVMQLGHGKEAPLQRLREGDYIIYYSPSFSLQQPLPLQSFTALGQVVDEEIFQFKMNENFHPFRRKVKYMKVTDTPIIPLLPKLSFIPNKKQWGYDFRFGLVEIPEIDFETIKKIMLE